jgi:hypothetical protein
MARALRTQVLHHGRNLTADAHGCRRRSMARPRCGEVGDAAMAAWVHAEEASHCRAPTRPQPAIHWCSVLAAPETWPPSRTQRLQLRGAPKGMVRSMDHALMQHALTSSTSIHDGVSLPAAGAPAAQKVSIACTCKSDMQTVTLLLLSTGARGASVLTRTNQEHWPLYRPTQEGVVKVPVQPGATLAVRMQCPAAALLVAATLT